MAQPVVVELFTSEGCSSCPPADVLLQHLDRNQPVSGVEVIALSEHVDYWNSIGWADPYSAPLYTDRQRRMASRLRTNVYTPQMVIDGKVEFVGSDSRRAFAEIAQAAKEPKADVSAVCAGDHIKVQVGGAPKDASVLVAIAENDLESNVTRGENSGRRLVHRAVVRRIESIGRTGANGFAGEAKLAAGRSWKREALSAIVLVEARDGRIAGARRIPLTGCAI